MGRRIERVAMLNFWKALASRRALCPLVLLIAIALLSSSAQVPSGTPSSTDGPSTAKHHRGTGKSSQKSKIRSDQRSSAEPHAKTLSGADSNATSSDSEIAAARSGGKVWVNLDSGIYHKNGRWYGRTKNGKFMTEAEAKAAGYKSSQRD